MGKMGTSDRIYAKCHSDGREGKVFSRRRNGELGRNSLRDSFLNTCGWVFNWWSNHSFLEKEKDIIVLKNVRHLLKTRRPHIFYSCIIVVLPFRFLPILHEKVRIPLELLLLQGASIPLIGHDGGFDAYLVRKESSPSAIARRTYHRFPLRIHLSIVPESP